MERIKKYEPLWGKWTVKRKIGEGSFGAVYEAESEKFGNKSYCAIKQISFKNEEMLQGVKKGETLLPEELEQLKIKEARKNVREAMLMEKLQGRDHIVTIYDYDIFPNESTTDIIIRMELLTNLNEYMELHKTDSEEEVKSLVIKLGIDIGKALEECEEEKIVHRDIKPDNIFVNKNGTFKLGDFGLSRKMNKSASFSLRKSAGTPFYMAPEALGWGNKTDYLSDIYSLGIVMYQLLNDGNIPFVSDMEDFVEVDEAIGKRVDREEIIAPKHDDGQLWKIIQKACQYKKEDRYQSAGEFRSELEKIESKVEVGKREEEEKKEDALNPEEILKELSKIKKELEELKTQKNERREENFQEKKIVKTQYNIGDSIFFGNYPQDADGTVRPIEWVILKKEEDKALLLSKYVLDAKPYNKEVEEVTWETSDIRKWLNNEFYRDAFSNAEKEKIQTILINTEDNPAYGTGGGNDTKDKAFLLSMKEAETLFLNDEERMAKAAGYAHKSGVYFNEENGNSVWWLRSPGISSGIAVGVDSYGWVIRDGYSIENDSNGVRPALWLKL